MTVTVTAASKAATLNLWVVTPLGSPKTIGKRSYLHYDFNSRKITTMKWQ